MSFYEKGELQRRRGGVEMGEDSQKGNGRESFPNTGLPRASEL